MTGAQVILQKDGQASVTGTTDAQGRATLTSPFGDDASVKLLVKKDGFTPLVVQCPCAGMSYAISESLGRQLDAFRVVLNWGASPSDLDLHAVYPNNHIFFSSKEGANAFLGMKEKVVHIADWNENIPAENLAKIKEVEAKIADGSTSPFAGPVVKADGSEAVASGATMSDADIIAMDWHVKGITTPLPK